MGLLDQVLGQVIGNMAGGGQGRPAGAPNPAGGAPGANPMGDILGQILAGSRGGPQQGGPQQGAGGGGLGDLLGQVLGGGQAGRAPGGQAPGPAPGGGGLGDLLGQVLGGGQAGRAPGGQAPGPAPGGGLGDLLGQILGGGQAGGAPAGQAPSPSPSPAPSPAPGGGGGLGSILGGAGGNLSPLVLAVLAVLASKHLSSGAGGFGSVLHDMFGGGAKPAESQDGQRQDGPQGYAGNEGPGYNPDDVEDGYGEPPGGAGGASFDPRSAGGPSFDQRGAGGGRGGGFLDDVGSMLDGPGGAPRQASGGGNLGDLLGGGFDDMQRRFEQNGQGDLLGSWIGHGANQQPSAGDLEKALGQGTIDQLSRQFGIDKNELLQQLSQALPQIVDGLTPQGRVPTPQERNSWI